VLFPEMALPGYLLGDEWENDALLRELDALNAEVAAYTKGRCAAIWSSIVPVLREHPAVLGAVPANGRRGEDGRTRKYNAALVAADGAYVSNGIFSGHTVKALMPKYREFDDERHFFSLLKLAQELGRGPAELVEPFELIIAGARRKVGVVLCEDMWDDDYAFKPVEVLKSKAADLLVNLSASPFGIGKHAKRDRILKQKSRGCSFFYANCVGSQDNGKNLFVFDGASPVYRDGRKLAQGRNFTDMQVTAGSGIAPEPEEIAKVHDALAAGLRASLKRIGATKVVVGLSGGIDSAVVATLSVRVLGKENVVGVNMPSRFNSATTKGLASKLADNLGICSLVAPIEDAVTLTRAQVETLTGRPVQGLVDENIQARDRSSRVLAAVAAQLGVIHKTNVVFTNNGNKTEVAQGYCTLYGDVCGAVAPIADLYKTQVRALARYLNATMGNPIPEGILTVKPSAELSDAQNPEQGGGDPFQFEYHDKLLYQLIELRRDPEDLLADAAAGNLNKALGLAAGRTAVGENGYFPTMADFVADLESVWRRFKGSFFKRVQAPPILAVSKRAFGYDLREFQGPAHFTRRYQTLKTELLGAPDVSEGPLLPR
jgi:NAD+ synthase (glutamine-hydrolysing)